MKTQEITFSKSNWSGNFATLTTNGNRFIIDGMPGLWVIEYPTQDTAIVSKQDEYNFYGFLDDNKWCFCHNGIEREHENAMVAFAQLMWNL